MATIQRRASYRIITRAIELDNQPLVAVLAPGAEDCEPALDPDQLRAALQTHPDGVIVYNQHDAARALVDELGLPATQVLIEIRQDTRGVLGLHALRRGPDGDETLELVYQ